jgi:hypothetical protein
MLGLVPTGEVVPYTGDTLSSDPPHTGAPIPGHTVIPSRDPMSSPGPSEFQLSDTGLSPERSEYTDDLDELFM